ncbi:hypothetical protein [Haloprofundus salilacus]|uniref:hypothetical protein n=1 Tax=Haloprofundus salilacus TaxID=2876190 RepID=UPI001CCC5025|nr:hypothetical protein [Haloprofundus salilacus]
MNLKNSLGRRPIEVATLAVFMTGVAAFLLVHSVTLATSRGGEMLAQVRFAWVVFVLAAVVGAVLVAGEMSSQ